MRYRNSNNTLAGWDTDAYLLAVTSRKDKEQKYFFANSRYQLPYCGFLILELGCILYLFLRYFSHK